MTQRTFLLVTLLLAGAMPQFAASRVAVSTAAPIGGVAEVVEKALPSVVRVMTTRQEGGTGNGVVHAGFPRQPEGAKPRGRTVTGEGSGVIVSAAGHILTNHHVIDGAVKIAVELSDERVVPARLVAADAATDLAVLQIEAQVFEVQVFEVQGLKAKGLTPMEFGDSAKLRVGEGVLAIGNPFGVGTTVTSGIVSAMGWSRANQPADEDYIQTDAAINPGNSGGPLLNAAGQLVGINTAILSPSGGSSGIGFALPSNLARRVMGELLEKGQVRRGFLGVGLQPVSPPLAEALELRRPGGAMVTDVAPESPAARAGLRKGDVVVGMNGRAIRDVHRLRLYIASAQPGARIQLALNREGEERVVEVVLAERTAAEAEPGPPTSAELLGGAMLAERPEGLVVLALEPNGEAAASGLETGDVIVGAGRRPVADLAGLGALLGAGKPVVLEVNRQGSTLYFAVTGS